MFNCIIRPKLEYDSVVWAPYQKDVQKYWNKYNNSELSIYEDVRSIYSAMRYQLRRSVTIEKIR